MMFSHTDWVFDYKYAYNDEPVCKLDSNAKIEVMRDMGLLKDKLKWKKGIKYYLKSLEKKNMQNSCQYLCLDDCNGVKQS